MKLKTGFLFVVMRDGAKRVLFNEKISLKFSCGHELLELICISLKEIRSQIDEPCDSAWSFDYEGDFKSVVDVLFRLSGDVDDLLFGGVERVLLFELSKHEANKVLRGLK